MFISSQFCHPDRNRSSQSDDLRSGGTLCLMFASDGWRSSQNGRPEIGNERRGDSASCRTAPLKPKPGFEWATCRWTRHLAPLNWWIDAAQGVLGDLRLANAPPIPQHLEATFGKGASEGTSKLQLARRRQYRRITTPCCQECIQ